MTTENHLFRVLGQFDPGNSEQQLNQFFTGIAQKIQELGRKQLQFGNVDPASLQRVQTEIAEAIKKGAVSGNAFAGLDRKLQESLLASNGSFGKFFSQQANVFTRQIEAGLAAARQRAAYNTDAAGRPTGKAFVTSRDIGIEGPSRNLFQVTAFDPREATQGQIAEARLNADRAAVAAAGRYNSSLGALESAVEKEVKAHQTAAAAAERSARQSEVQRGRETLALEGRREAEFKAAMAESSSLIRQGLRDGGGTRLADALNAARLAEVDRQAARQNVSFPNPNTATGVGRAQAAVNAAESRLITATEHLAKVRTSDSRTVESVIAAEQRHRAALATLTAAQEKLRIASAAPPPTPRGLFEQFKYGFKGQADAPYAQQLGQAFKFSAFYGTAYKLLFAFTQTLQQTLQEGIDFQTAVSELKLATGQSAEAAKDLANELGQIAADAGFASSQGALAGARSIGLYGATGADTATQNTVARISADVASKLAFNSGMQIQDVQTTLAAITNAFRLGYTGQNQVADFDAYLGKRFGVAPGQTIQAVAESGSVAQQAGFSLEQTNAIAALLMGRTGQTASAVAGWMAQIFSRGGEGALASVAGRYGVDTTQTLERQIAQLAEVYKNASPNEQNEIAAAFGRGKVQNAVSVLLGSFDEVSKAADDAAKGLAEGASDKAFGERINNIGGQLQLLLADFKEFANQLGQSGVLSLLGLTAEGLDALLGTTTDLLKAWNQLPDAVRAVVASFALLALANRTQAGRNVISGVTTGLLGGGFVGRNAAGRLVVNAAGPGAAGGVPLASRAGLNAAAGLAGTALMSAGPWIAATAGLVALGSLAGAATDLRDEMRKSVDLLGADTAGLTSPDQLRTRAEQLRNQAGRDSVSGLSKNVLNALFLGTLSDSEKKLDDALNREADFLTGRAKAQENRPPEFEAKFLPLDQAGLAEGLDQMTKAGATAEERFDALRIALLGAGEAADRAKAAFDPDDFSARVAAAISQDVSGQGGPLANTNVDVLNLDTVFDLTNRLPGKHAPRTYVGPQSGYDTKGLQDRIRKALDEAKIISENLTPEQMSAIAESVVRDIPDGAIVDSEGNKVKGDALKDYRQHLKNLIVAQLGKQTEDVRSLLDENRRLLPEEMNAALATLLQEAQGRVAQLPQSDLDGVASVWRETVRTIRAAISKQRRHGAPITPQDLANLQAAERALVDAEIARLEDLRIAAQQQVLGDRAAVERVGKSFFQREARLAISHGKAGADALVNLVKTAGEWGRRAAIGVINQMMRAIQDVVVQAASIQTSIKGQLNYVGTSDQIKKLEELAGLKFDVANVPSGDPERDPFKTGSDVPGYRPPEKPDDPEQTAEERRQKLLSIRSSLRHLAANLNDPLAEARLAVADALDQVKFATDRESRLAAQVQLKDARHELDQLRRQMVLSIRSSLRLLAIDLSNPLAEARVAVADALDRVRNAVNREERLAARVDLRRARIDLEAQKFSQRLQAVQTAEELGRISHLKYISYLEHEKQRLESVKKRTYQQQQQLDEVERLLKGAADSLQGQWNFGDIKLPTPYEVRRRVEELYGGRGSNVGYAGVQGAPTDLLPTGSSSVQNVKIHINGADVAKVRQVVSEYIGSATTTRTTTPGYH